MDIIGDFESSLIKMEGVKLRFDMEMNRLRLEINKHIGDEKDRNVNMKCLRCGTGISSGNNICESCTVDFKLFQVSYKILTSDRWPINEISKEANNDYDGEKNR